MKRLLALVAGMIGLRALLKRHSEPAPAASPAEELRAKLAETKPPPEPTVDERRADVHARARQALDDLREP